VKVEGGRWKVEGESGRWKVEGGRWKVEGGRWKVEMFIKREKGETGTNRDVHYKQR
jgi:hypothetical protein